jgi:hypothetical protein
MEDIVSQAKAEYLRSKARVANSLATTLDDKINWSPSLTARTPIEIVAHCASAVHGIQGMLQGKPFPFPSIPEADAAFRLDEKRYKTREQVLTLLDEASNSYIAYLDALTPEQVASTIAIGGEVPLAAAMTFPADHNRGHAAQIEYLQTIWGDHDWHM